MNHQDDINGQWGSQGLEVHGRDRQKRSRRELSRNRPGETPLHAALSSHRAAQHWVVKVLLDAGADPNIATNPSVESGAFMRDVRTRGETTVHRAAAFANEDTIQLLLDAGARIDAKDANGDSPLTWASWHLCPYSVLRKLLYGGFSIHQARRTMDSYLLGTPLASPRT